MSRRPSISVNNYPEHLNPFHENDSTYQAIKESNKENKDTHKESKNKFWPFTGGRKKRSSFSIKSKWNEIFGKHKSTDAFADRRVGVTAGTTKNELNGRPYSSSRFTHKDQLEFDEAIGTLARRRKYTYDSSARPNSTSSAVSGPPRVVSEENKNTTDKLDVTPKPPARSRFGQVSPRATDKFPTLCYDDKDQDQSAAKQDQTPLPPKRNGLRASQRFAPQPPVERREVSHGATNDSKDENENVPEDCYVFKRCHQDPVRMSNLSISSCISISSTASAYSRKKRRAPPPPRPREMLETTRENEVRQVCETSKVEVKIIDSETKDEKASEVDANPDKPSDRSATEVILPVTVEVELSDPKKDPDERIKENAKPSEPAPPNPDSPDAGDQLADRDSQSNEFSVKDEIEKIEQQIQELQAKTSYDDKHDVETCPKRSIEENRRTFFKSLVDEQENGVDVQLKELPRVQNECEIIRLSDAQIEEKLREAVKVIELHISEPIRQQPEIVRSPVPRMKRSTSFTTEVERSVEKSCMESKGSKSSL